MDSDIDCVFCKIIAGRIPSTRVYEDSDTVAFLDINPVTMGHTLVIPRQHCDPIYETPPEVLQRVILSVQKVARAQILGLKADAVNVTQANGVLAGQCVPHLHFHVIPRFASDPEPRNWHPGKYKSSDEPRALAERIRAAIKA
jgi:histidine triad (HIT) family protein